MIRNLFLLLSLFSICLKTYSGDTTLVFKRNALFIEGGGKGPYYSVNYSRIFKQGNKLIYSWRAGFSLLSHDLSVPLAISAFTSGIQHHLEFSIGLTPYLKGYKTFLKKKDLSDKQIYITPGIGYRFQKITSSFFIAAGFDPLIFADPPSGNFWNFKPEFKPCGHLVLGLVF
ncbi:MAG: hypothetical protein ABIN97_03750 [Ginsengibacter sp.]